MTYIPTKEELEEMGFLFDGGNYTKLFGSVKLTYTQFSFILWNFDKYFKEFYPQSLEDLKTLIRILTPQ